MPTQLPFHPLSALFPLMAEPELAALAADIAAGGLREPVRLLDGAILDGRNRYLACQRLGVEPQFMEYTGAEPARYVVSLNLARRHLTPSQAAACAVEALPALELEAKKRQKAQGECGKRGGRGRKKKTLTQKIGEGLHANESADQAAALFCTNRQYVSDAKRIKDQAPALFEALKAGEKTMPQARRELKRAAHAQAVQEKAHSPEPPAGPFDLILADPPWQYDFSETACREIENHYPTAGVELIAQHKPDAKDDSVLFLWATAPKLREAMTVMEAWGFEYRTHAIWDKETLGMGYWFRGQHELLLVGVRGQFSATPECARVSSVFREKRAEHSRKPGSVYEWIEHAFPAATKLEMYCRNPRQGWATWGNEVKPADVKVITE
jgi:N6-adenosine-specific RNA methylase IME4